MTVPLPAATSCRTTGGVAVGRRERVVEALALGVAGQIDGRRRLDVIDRAAGERQVGGKHDHGVAEQEIETTCDRGRCGDDSVSAAGALNFAGIDRLVERDPDRA